ncbi:MAG: hypothetical protein IJ615_05465 [Bacteroidaceae bacterium]|nr:hypothetical protein [Bacteroidaceae bacterium]
MQRKKFLFILALLCTIAQGAWSQNGICCTASDVGRVVCTDGSIYDNVSAAEAAGKKAAAKIMWVNESTKKGLALALYDEGFHNYQGGINRCASKNNSFPVAGGTWKLATKDEWDTMFNAAGGAGSLRTSFGSVGGSDMTQHPYISSSLHPKTNSRYYFYMFSGWYTGWSTDKVDLAGILRPCLSFNLLTLYTIGTTNEWNAFCAAVNNGDTFSDKYVKLTANWISTMNAMAGTDETHSFQGTFDGNGFTLTNNQGTADPISTDYLAPFRHVKNAVFKNLTVNGQMYVNAKFAAGFVGVSYGNLTIVNCCSSVGIHGRKSGDGTHGGFVALLSGADNTIVIDNCIFDGEFTTKNSTTNCGGFIGWPTNNKPTIKNSLMKPSNVYAGMLDNTFARWHSGYEPTITNCYFVNPGNLPTNQGTQLLAAVPDNAICKKVTVAGTELYSPVSTVSGVGASYDLGNATEPVYITPTVTDAYDKVLTFGTDFTATLNGQNVTSLPIRLVEAGNFTLVITGTGDYSGSKTFSYTATGEVRGEKEGCPILISSASDWETFANNVNNGTNVYQGKYFYLNADITVSTMMGSSSANSFQGHFDGGNHTLTFTNGSSGSAFGEENCAPFRYTKGATVKNLKVAGEIFTSKKFAAGLIARSYDATTITNCHASTVIHSSVSDDGTHGGLVAMPDNSLTIEGCSFSGRLFTTNGTNKCGGFVGWGGNNLVTVSNSLYAPDTDIAAAAGETPINHANTFVRGINLTIDANSCYYTETMGDAQGILVYTSAPENEISQKMQMGGGKYFYKLGTTVSGVDNSYELNNTVEATITNNSTSTNLAFDTDFTATLNGVQVEEWPIYLNTAGDYTLTLTGTGNYAGSKSYNFYVGEYMPITESSTTLATGSYMVYRDVTINERITINGDNDTGTILYLGAGTTLHAKKGIELAESHRLTVYGPGALIIDECADGKSGIGAASMGTLTIYGGRLDIAGATGAAGIGSDAGSEASGALSLIWTHEINDYVTCSSYSLGYPIHYSSSFVIEGETTVITSNDNIDGKKIVPYLTEVMLSDGTPYDLTSDLGCASATYTKTLGEERVGKHQAWFVPFDYTITATDAEKFTFYKINMIANSPDPESEATDDIWMFVKKMAAGDVLHANMPYLYKPKEAVTDYAFTTENAVLKAKANDARITMMTAEETYTLYGTYGPTAATAQDPFYYMNIDGSLSLGNNGTVTVGAFRWIMRVESKFGGSTPAYVRKIVIFDGEDDEATGIAEIANSKSSNGKCDWYTLDGRRLNGKPSRAGVYIYNGIKTIIK